MSNEASNKGLPPTGADADFLDSELDPDKTAESERGSGGNYHLLLPTDLAVWHEARRIAGETFATPCAQR